MPFRRSYKLLSAPPSIEVLDINKSFIFPAIYLNLKKKIKKITLETEHQQNTMTLILN